LSVQYVIVPGLWIDAKAGRYHLVRSEGGDHVVDHLALIETHLAGARAVDVELQRGVVDILRNEDVGHAWDAPNARGKLQGGGIGSFHVGTGHLHVDGRRKSQVQDRVD